jgi:thioredoxin reductase
VTDPILELRGNETGLETIQLASGVAKPCDALFFCTECQQRSSLPAELGCLFDEEGSVVCEEHAAKNVSGLYIAGNVRGGVHLAITAAAEGAETAIAMNEALLKLRGRTADRLHV